MIKNTITADKSQIKEAFGICKCQYFSHQNQKPKNEVNSTHKNQSECLNICKIKSSDCVYRA